MRSVTRGLMRLLAAASLLAACAGQTVTPAPTAPPPVASTVPVEAAATATAATATAAPSPTAPAASATALAPEATPAAEVTVVASPAASDELNDLLSDPILSTYRVMVAMQVNAAFLHDTAVATAAGAMEGDDLPVAALVFGALTQAVDQDVADGVPPSELAAPWAAALAAHDGIKQVAGRWLVGELSAEQMAADLAPLQADLEAALVQADAVMAQTYHVQATSLTAYRARVALALEKLFE
ncbi:MAG: hypothetical protein IT317_09010 [Anaerolineales bacterium]|nr:hypothetical protein [Anaerolineales bacterium]